MNSGDIEAAKADGIEGLKLMLKNLNKTCDSMTESSGPIKIDKEYI
jgi:hypothetical protein